MMTHSVIFKRFAISLATLGFTAHIILDAATVVSGVGVLFETRTGARNHGGRLSRYEVNSSKHCAVRCVQHRECNSYNLGPVPMRGGGDGGGGNSRSCELAKADGNATVSVMRKAGWTSFLKNLASNEPMFITMPGERLSDINYLYWYKLTLFYCNNCTLFLLRKIIY